MKISIITFVFIFSSFCAQASRQEPVVLKKRFANLNIFKSSSSNMNNNDTSKAGGNKLYIWGHHFVGLGRGKKDYFNGLIFSGDELPDTLNGIGLGARLSGDKTNGALISPFAVDLNEMNGISIALLGSSIDMASGITICGLVNWHNYNTKGLHLSGLIYHSGDFFNDRFHEDQGQDYGLFVSGLLSHTANLHGLSISTFNSAFTIMGVQLGGANFCEGSMQGVQVGAYNYSEKLKGVQIGLFNHAEKSKGVQFGLINYIKENPEGLRVLPFINVGIKSKTT
jgi:hypothetical protein